MKIYELGYFCKKCYTIDMLKESYLTRIKYNTYIENVCSNCGNTGKNYNDVFEELSFWFEKTTPWWKFWELKGIFHINKK